MSVAFRLLSFASFIYECPQKFRTLHAKIIALVFTAQLNLRPHLNSYIKLTLRYVTKLGDSGLSILKLRVCDLAIGRGNLAPTIKLP